MSFYAFDVDCDEMTEEYITWCLLQTSKGSCTPYQLAWDGLCYRMCEALQGVVCTLWTRRKFCEHTPSETISLHPRFPPGLSHRRSA